MSKNAKRTFSVVDMVVLGILIKQPMNAYALALYVEQKNITRLVKLSTPAIYKSCKRLYTQGFLHGELKRDGEAPEKMLYNVTALGMAQFGELMTHFASTISPFYFDINSVVYCLDELDFEQGLQLIDAYREQISGVMDFLIPHSKEAGATSTFANRMIVKQYLMTVRVLIEWSGELREEFVEQHNRGGQRM